MTRPLALAVLLLLPAVASAGRPNLVVLLADDMRADAMGCAGHPVVQTPNLDALAKDGVRFRNALVTTAICAASRASLFTGLHERTHRYTFGTKPVTDEHVDLSYPAALKRAGYRTGFVGKFGIGVRPGARDRMFDSITVLDRNPYWKKQPDGTSKHLTDVEGEAAVAFLDGVKPGEPFCLSVSFNAPHAEDTDPNQYYWQKEVDHLYADAVFPTSKTMAREFVDALPPFLRDPKSESRIRFGWRFDNPEKYQRMVRGYYRMISGVDLVVGRIRTALAKRGLADDTVIVFTADNGYFLGERGFADKWYIYEPSIRVPLLVYDPRSKVPRVVDRMALNIDLSPTLLDLAGVPVPAAVQGRSLTPLLKGEPPADWRTDFFYEHLFERKNIPKSEGVRTERFSYVRWFEQTPLVEELYDHVADPDQATNLIAEAKHTATAEALRKRTTELRDRYGGPFRSNAAK